MSDSLANRLTEVRGAIRETRKKRHGEKKRRVDALLVSDIVNVGYLSGFTGSTAIALIAPDKAYLITDARYAIRARAECPHFEVVIASLSAASIDELVRILAAYEADLRIGFETSVSYAQLDAWKAKAPAALRWRPTNGIVEQLRALKDDGEIAAIRKAVEIAEAAFADVQPLVVAGTTERDFALELDTAMRRRGAARVSFDTIVAAGENGANPHYTPSDAAFARGELVTIDWGAEYEGYCSDLTRTVLVPGKKPTAKQSEIHEIVRTAKQLATDAIAPGKSGKEIDAIARDYISCHGYGDNFGHSLGHAIGRVVHDGPALSSRADVVLAPGMVVTVEPGIYIEGWGGVRIEEDVLVTETGCEVLSKPSGPLIEPAPSKSKSSQPAK